jgi:flagellar biosynthesis protein FlhB
MLKGLPSKERLRELRSKGRVSLSSFATRALILAAVSLAVLTAGQPLRQITQAALNPELGVQHEIGERLWLGGAARVVLISAAAAILAAVLASLMQTRFTVGWALLRRQLVRRSGRLHPFRTVLLMVSAAVLASVIVRLVAHDLLLVVRLSDAESLSKALAVVLARICKLVVVAGVVLAIIWALVARIGFIFRFREGEQTRGGPAGD